MNATAKIPLRERYAHLLQPLSPSEGRGPLKGRDIAPSERQKQVNVLFVDDETTVRMIAGRMFKLLGQNRSVEFSVTLATNGQEALDILRENPDKFEIILLDRTMPVMDGDELFQKMGLKDKERVIFQSGHEEEKGLLSITHMGRPILAKPWRVEDLGKAIDILDALRKEGSG